MDVESSTYSQRRSVAAVALIRRTHEGRTCYLAQWNPKWMALHFVSGHKRPEETFRECIIREISEELRLTPGTDVFFAGAPGAVLEFAAWSKSAGVETLYEMAVFQVQLSGGSAMAKVAANPDNRWVTEGEILLGQCADGTRISPTMARILTTCLKEQAWRGDAATCSGSDRHGTCSLASA